MNKRLIILFSCLAIVAIVATLAFAVFVVRNVEISATEEGFVFDTDTLIESSGIKMNSSIFTISEQACIDNIETKNPYIKVINVERKFPSKVIIHIAQRVAVFAINIKDNDSMLAIDEDLKVVEVLSKEQVKEKNLTVVIGYEQEVLGILDSAIGAYLDTENADIKRLKDIYFGFSGETYSRLRFNQLAEGVDISNHSEVELRTREGSRIIYKGYDFIAEQVKGSLAVYTKLSPTEKKNATIINEGDGWVRKG